MKPFFSLLSFLLLACQILCQSPYIQVDQFGYQPSAAKVAVLSNPMVGFNAGDSYSPAAQLELRNATTDVIVFQAAPTAWNGGATHAQSGDQGWWFDFSSITTVGSYYVHDATNNESSAIFDIRSDIYDDVLMAAGRMYYYNRCGMAKSIANAGANWADAISFTQDANTRYVHDKTNAALEKDLSGGWFDAGDYNKYVTFTHNALHSLLWAYQENPGAFSDNWNIPDSGNGIPDILDEIKWELEWLMKMTNADGSVHIKIGSQNHSDNSSAPPSVNSNTRYYGPTCTSASITIASVFAHAAKVFSSFDSAFAALLEVNAEQAWTYVLPSLTNNTLETSCDNGEIVAGDADWSITEQRDHSVTAAVYLYDLTSTAAYNTYIINNINHSTPVGNGNWDNYHISSVDAMLLYSTLPNADPTIANDIISAITTDVNNNWNNYFGWNNLDLYRAHASDWIYHWGSNKPKANFGVLNNLLVNYGINPTASDSYTSRAAGITHYFHGVNPLGLVYLSNMSSFGAERSANEIYHVWFQDGTDWDNAETSLYGPAPGYITGGSNTNYTANTNLTPPYNQPAQKSYLDWNTGYPENSWEITEPSITYQAPYIRLLAAYTTAQPLAVEWSKPLVATYTKGTVVLDWSTVHEENTDKFDILFSIDGQNFQTIGQVLAAGESSVYEAYDFVHLSPVKGQNFYRLKQWDVDESYTYSRVVSVNITEHIEVNVFPNPADKYLQVNTPSGQYQFRITTIGGHLLTQSISKGPKHTLSIESLFPGTYMLEVVNLTTGFFVKERFVKI